LNSFAYAFSDDRQFGFLTKVALPALDNRLNFLTTFTALDDAIRLIASQRDCSGEATAKTEKKSRFFSTIV
jgi:hypothetical protein